MAGSRQPRSGAALGWSTAPLELDSQTRDDAQCPSSSNLENGTWSSSVRDAWNLSLSPRRLRTEDEPNYTAPQISNLMCPGCGHKDTYAPTLMSRRQGPEKS
jgi:hypothetical protein